MANSGNLNTNSMATNNGILGGSQRTIPSVATVTAAMATVKPSTATTTAATVASAMSGKDGWLKGWPKLAGAAALAADQRLSLLNDFLHRARETGCSDVHLSAGALPFVRRYKIIHLLADQEVLSKEDSEALNLAPLTPLQLEKYEKTLDFDYSYNITTDDRYRTNLLQQRLGISGSYRLIDTHIRSIRELGFKQPEVVEKMTTHNQGLILITGPAGCGKSATMSAMVDYLNQTRHDHIITVEDPIEVVHIPKGCNITQRELNVHTRSFGNALRAALREDPDIIVIGELRDLETIEMAIHSSETGHLVIGTLHTNSAADTMNRILDVFPHNQQAQIRAMLAESLKGVICQQLVPNKDENGVVLAAEIMIGNLAVSNLIREGKTFQIESTIQTSKNIGMVTMEQSHFDLYMAGRRSYEQTLPLIKNRDLIRQMQIQEAQRLSGQSNSQQTATQQVATHGAGHATPPPPLSPSPLSAPKPPPPLPKSSEEPPKKRFGWF